MRSKTYSLLPKRTVAAAICAMMVLGVLALGSRALADGAMGPSVESAQAGNGMYVPGEIVVKIKPERASEIRESSSRLGIPSIDRVCSQRNVKKASRVLPGHDPQKAAAKFPQRSRRASGGARSADPAAVFRLQADEQNMFAAINELKADPAVEYAEPNYMLQFHAATPNDPIYQDSSHSWGQTYPDQWNLRQVKLPEAWSSPQGSALGSGVTIAVIDTGVDFDQVELLAATNQGVKAWINPNEIPGNGKDDDGNGFIDDICGADMCKGNGNVSDYNSHGTAVAGIASARTGNGRGIAGASWYSRIMAVKVSPVGPDDLPFDYAPETAVSRGIDYAVQNGADVINLSMGGYPSKCMRDAIDYAFASGCVIVSSSGNNSGFANNYPAVYDEVLSVGATDQAGNICDFSTTSAGVDVAAPGGTSHPAKDVLDKVNPYDVPSFITRYMSTIPCPLSTDVPSRIKQNLTNGGLLVGPDCFRTAGTSLSSPLVAGIAALVISAHPDWSNAQVMATITGTATDKGAPGWDPYYGHGVADAYAAVTSPPPNVAMITSPDMRDEMPGGNIAVMGFAYGPEFLEYTVEIAPGEELGSSSFNTSSVVSPTPVKGQVGGPGTKPGALAIINLGTGNQSTTGYYTIRLRVKTATGYRESRTVVKRTANNNKGGFPIEMGASQQHSTPCIADVDGDGAQEIAVAANSAFTSTGFLASNAGCTHQAIYVMKSDGKVLPGWPQYIDYQSAVDGSYWQKDFFRCQVLVDDLEGDGTKEVVVTCQNRMRVYDAGGALKWERVFTTDLKTLSKYPDSWHDKDSSGDKWLNANQFGALAIGDINGDHKKEITGRIDVRYFPVGAGNEYDEFPEPSRTVGTFPEDPQGPEMVIDFDNPGVPASCVMAYDCKGKTVTGWDSFAGFIDLPGSFNEDGPPGMTCADINNDNADEVIVNTYAQRTYVFSGQGNVRKGWPVKVSGTLEDETPAVGDLNGDGRQEIVVSTRHSQYNLMWIWTGDATSIGKAPANYGRFPVLADIDGNGYPEIITNGYGKNTYLQPDPVFGGLQISTIKNLSGGFATWETRQLWAPQAASKLAVGDLDGDGRLDAAYGTSGTNMKMCAFDLDTGAAVPGFIGNAGDPVSFFYNVPIVRNPLIADVDGNGKAEVVATSDNGRLNCWTTSGTCPKNQRSWTCEGGSPAAMNRYIEPQQGKVYVMPSSVGPGLSANVNLEVSNVSAQGFVQKPALLPDVDITSKAGGSKHLKMWGLNGNAFFLYTAGDELAEGTYTATVSWSDAAGNPLSASRDFKVDRTAPTLWLLSPTTKAPVGKTFNMRGIVGDTLSGVWCADVYLDSKYVAQITMQTAGDSVGSFDYVFTMPSWAVAGPHSLVVIGRDQAGNSSLPSAVGIQYKP